MKAMTKYRINNRPSYGSSYRSSYRKSNRIANAVGRKSIAIAPIWGFALAFAASVSVPAQAHPGKHKHQPVMKAPIAGVYNNHWYDYRTDVLEAEHELHKDVRRAKTAEDKREAWAEYNQELRDARKDYTKEMIEKGYIRRRVTVGG
jgi:hypothetical protein